VEIKTGDYLRCVDASGDLAALLIIMHALIVFGSLPKRL
jgi:hypothetical protein